MEHQRQSNGWQTFHEHWGIVLMAFGGLIVLQIHTFFSRLSGASWIRFYAMALLAAAVGIALIFYAKVPLYRQRRFFTFGGRALPDCRRSFYRWGYRCVAVAVVLLLCLLLSSS